MKNSPDTARRFFALSDAYLMAAAALAERASNSQIEDLDAVGSSCMFNARLAVELLLKGMIVLRNPSAKINGHALEIHRKEYIRLYPKEGFRWEVPFTVQFIGGNEEEREAAQSNLLKKRPLDQIFRYPVDNKGQPWETVEGFSPEWFREFLQKIAADIARLKELLLVESCGGA